MPALSPALFNVVAVSAGYAMWALNWSHEEAVYGWAAATLLGGLVTLLVQTPALYRLGLRFRFVLAFRDPGLRRMFALMAPATIGIATIRAE